MCLSLLYSVTVCNFRARLWDTRWMTGGGSPFLLTKQPYEQMANRCVTLPWFATCSEILVGKKSGCCCFLNFLAATTSLVNAHGWDTRILLRDPDFLLRDLLFCSSLRFLTYTSRRIYRTLGGTTGLPASSTERTTKLLLQRQVSNHNPPISPPP